MPVNDDHFHVSFPPHVTVRKSVSSMMVHYLIALLPAAIAGLYYFREGALKVLVAAVLSAVICEAGVQKLLKRDLIWT